MFSSLISSVVFGVFIITSTQTWTACASPAASPLLSLDIAKAPGAYERYLAKHSRRQVAEKWNAKRTKHASDNGSGSGSSVPSNGTIVANSAAKTNGTKISTVEDHKSGAAPSAPVPSSDTDTNANSNAGNSNAGNSNSNSNSNSNTNAQPFIVPNPLPNPNNAPPITGSASVTFSTTFLQLSTANPTSPPGFDLASSSGASQASLHIAMVGYINQSPADAASFAYTMLTGDLVDAYGILDMDFQCGMITGDIWNTLGAAINTTLSSCTSY